MPEELGTGKVWVGDAGAVDYDLYKAGSAQKHAASDNQTLKTALQKAINAPDSKKEYQGNGVYRFKINGGLGYLVYKLKIREREATIFHYHWNYRMDLPLGVD